MAIPSRFIKPAARPAKKASVGINPTIIGVLLSVGAHALLIMFAPRANFSFAALSEAAQQQDAEETIVPVVELTAAERNRLPSFAQPRRLPPTPTGLDSLALPPGLPRVSTTTPRTRQSSPQSTTRRIPSATTQTTIRPQIRQRLPQSVTRAPLTLNPGRVANRNVTRSNSAVEFFSPTQPSQTALNQTSPTVGPDGLPILEGQTPLALEAPSTTTSNGSASDLTIQPSGDLLGEVIARQNASTGSDTNDNNATESPDTGSESAAGSEESGTAIAVETEAINPAPAQGDPRQLLAGYSYDPTDVDEEAAETNLEEWLVASAENKSEVDSATATLEIDSQFKVCKENAPSTGLIGVVVNPDGSQENAEVLKSIGYDILNRQALAAIEYNEFEQPSQATQYQITIDVIYEPEGCVEALPEAEE
ncbi:MAG: TonB family protein [Cyanobacteria bacterium J06621_11]